MNATTDDAPATQIASQLGQLNDQILDMSREATRLCLEAYESSVDSLAGYLEEAASRTDIDGVASAAAAQARMLREMATRQVAMVHELLN